MITIDVQPYCESCLDFTPDVDGPVRYYGDQKVICQSDTIVRCKYRKRCENMVRYLQKQMEQAKEKPSAFDQYFIDSNFRGEMDG